MNFIVVNKITKTSNLFPHTDVVVDNTITNLILLVDSPFDTLSLLHENILYQELPEPEPCMQTYYNICNKQQSMKIYKDFLLTLQLYYVIFNNIETYYVYFELEDLIKHEVKVTKEAILNKDESVIQMPLSNFNIDVRDKLNDLSKLIDLVENVIKNEHVLLIEWKP